LPSVSNRAQCCKDWSFPGIEHLIAYGECKKAIVGHYDDLIRGGDNTLPMMVQDGEGSSWCELITHENHCCNCWKEACYCDVFRIFNAAKNRHIEPHFMGRITNIKPPIIKKISHNLKSWGIQGDYEGKAIEDTLHKVQIKVHILEDIFTGEATWEMFPTPPLIEGPVSLTGTSSRTIMILLTKKLLSRRREYQRRRCIYRLR